MKKQFFIHLKQFTSDRTNEMGDQPIPRPTQYMHILAGIQTLNPNVEMKTDVSEIVSASTRIRHQQD
jgi:hypothetical protein